MTDERARALLRRRTARSATHPEHDVRRHRLLDRVARPRALDRRRRRARRAAPRLAAARVRARERRRVQRGLGLGGGHVRRPAPARQPGRDRRRERPAGLRLHARRARPLAARRALRRLRLGRARRRRPRRRGAREHRSTASPAGRRRPHVVVAHTIFGRGVSFMEGADRLALLAVSTTSSTPGARDLELERAPAVRNAFAARARPSSPRSDERIVLLTGDLGFTVLERFAERLPERFFNVGVAEQNMVGLRDRARRGRLHPFVYSIATFASMRPYEFIRNGAAAAPPAGAHRRHRRRASTTGTTASPTTRSRTSV